MKSIILTTITPITLFTFTACRKIINIPPPTNSITTSQVFSTNEQATSATAGIYYQMINSDQCIFNSSLTICAGMSADELIVFNQAQSQYVQFQKNTLLLTNPIISGNLWSNAYSIIYDANAVIEGLQGLSGVQDSVKSELTGEAEFIRAFCNFYLVNLFGDIPLVSTINYRNTNLLSRTPSTKVYDLIISDLQDAQKRLAPDYSVGNGQRIIPNKWAATALLARVYLYLGRWNDAETQSTAVINNTGLFNLEQDLNSVFLINSKEAIWQLQQDNLGSSFNATPEGYTFIPIDATSHPLFYLTSTVLDSFETNDARKLNWIDSTVYSGLTYYYPYKYKMGADQSIAGGDYSEYYMVMRLAEQYLIRSEARARLGNTTDAASDLDIIRNRAGLNNTSANTQADLLTAIMHERQIELFAEWGHRWLDLKRSGEATSVLSATKGFSVTNNVLLYPIPSSDLQTDPNLKQNPGYN